MKRIADRLDEGIFNLFRIVLMLNVELPDEMIFLISDTTWSRYGGLMSCNANTFEVLLAKKEGKRGLIKLLSGFYLIPPHFRDRDQVRIKPSPPSKKKPS